MTIARFEELIAWQKARAFATAVHVAPNSRAFVRDNALSVQLRKAAVSIAANIAAGLERGGRAEFAQFLSGAVASCAEVRTHLSIAHDVGCIDVSTLNESLTPGGEVGKLVGGLRAAVAKQRASRNLSPRSSVLSPSR